MDRTSRRDFYTCELEMDTSSVRNTLPDSLSGTRSSWTDDGLLTPTNRFQCECCFPVSISFFRGFVGDLKWNL
jgi:hypothetical protein